MQRLFQDAQELMVIINPLEGSDYRTLVDVLDEMTINGVSRYAITDPELLDHKLLAFSQ